MSGRSGVAIQAFSAHPAECTALRRRLVPGNDAFYGAVVDSLALVRGGMRRVLDVGAGTGAARDRMRYDRCAHTETHLCWLREAGFASADCVDESWRFAVMLGLKGGLGDDGNP